MKSTLLGSGLVYDGSGNITSDSASDLSTTHNYNYDAEDRLVQVDGTTSYVIDAEGHRVAKKVGGSVTEEYLYDKDGQLVTTIDAG